jgi:hypothetical protein
MSGATHPLPQYAFMAWCSVKKKKHRDNFIPRDVMLKIFVNSVESNEIVNVFRELICK